MTNPDWSVLVPRFHDPRSMKEKARDIADFIASDAELSPLFRRMLAGMISGEHNSTPYEFVMRHKRGGRPKAVDWPVAREMERLVDVEEMPVDAAVWEVHKKFGKDGNSRSKCLKLLAKAREQTALQQFVDSWSEKAGPE